MKHQQKSKWIEKIDLKKSYKTTKLRMNKIKSKNWTKKNDRNDLKCETNKYVYNFQQFQMIRSFGILNGKVTISEADKNQSNLFENVLEFNTKVTQDLKQIKRKKQRFWKYRCSLWGSRITS